MRDQLYQSVLEYQIRNTIYNEEIYQLRYYRLLEKLASLLEIDELHLYDFDEWITIMKKKLELVLESQTVTGVSKLVQLLKEDHGLSKQTQVLLLYRFLLNQQESDSETYQFALLLGDELILALLCIYLNKKEVYN